jgi:hypothetical protein
MTNPKHTLSLKMEATYLSEYLLPVYKSKLNRIQEDGTLTINYVGT